MKDKFEKFLGKNKVLQKPVQSYQEIKPLGTGS